MIGTRIVLKRGTNEEAEKPFWISFADLMTALMVLFLVAMSVALLAVTKTITEAEVAQKTRDEAIQKCLVDVGKVAKDFTDVHVDQDNRVIDFGDRARFETNSSRLNSDQGKLLRAFVPRVLDLARNGSCDRWLKHIVVEGFADQRGTYLLNLNLSLQRAERVLCALLDKPGDDERPMSDDELEQVRELFLVGGYSFNSAKSTLDESRRIELRLEFLAVNDFRPQTDSILRGSFGVCGI